MKRFLKKILIFTIPVFIWGIIVLLVDPFNYFNFSIVNNEAKKSAQDLNTLLYRSIDYMKHPCENMLIGDSRTNALPEELLETVTGEEWKRLNINAAKLNEIFELFYMANEKKPLKRVIIGINFNMFNKYGYMDRVSGVKKMLSNPLMYLYNKDVTEATGYTLMNLVTGKEISSVPALSKEAFWDWNISVKATHWYGKYEYPDTLYAQLLQFDAFTQTHGIDVWFVIVPHHDDFHERLVEFGLEAEERRFKEMMYALNANVYDYDYPNEITADKANFNDPVHYNDSIGHLIVNELFGGQLHIGRTNKPVLHGEPPF